MIGRAFEAGLFHDFHMTWIGLIRIALNEGVLPEGYYALAEQHTGRTIPDILALHASPGPLAPPLPLPPATGGTVPAEAPPRLRRRHVIEEAVLERRRSLAIRHISGHRLVALLEIVSPANKDHARHVEDFAAKAADALASGVHLLLVDLFPPGPHDPYGMHGAVCQRLEQSDEPYDVPAEAPLTVASFAAGPRVEVYLEYLAVGADSAGDAAVPAPRPLRQRALGVDVPGGLSRHAGLLARRAGRPAAAGVS